MHDDAPASSESGLESWDCCWSSTRTAYYKVMLPNDENGNNGKSKLNLDNQRKWSLVYLLSLSEIGQVRPVKKINAGLRLKMSEFSVCRLSEIDSETCNRPIMTEHKG